METVLSISSKILSKSFCKNPKILNIGILHNRGFGAASHIGVVMDVPSIGVGKTVFAVDGITQKGVKEMSEQKLLKGGDLEY